MIRKGDPPELRSGIQRTRPRAKGAKGIPDEIALQESVTVTRFDALLNWARKNSIWPLPYATACCGIEFMGAVSSVFDISRFGAEVVRFSPRQADLLLVAGTINYKQAPILRRIYDQMPEPKWVFAMGVCASSGGFYDNYSTLQGIDKLIPVDYYIGGCPPRPEAVLKALLELQKRIDSAPAPR
jgi:NADH-quinone oxidoreductase subunit B